MTLCGWNNSLNLFHQTCFPPDQLLSHLQVSVHDAHVMQVLHSIQDLLDELTGIFLRVKSFFHNPVEELTTRHSANGKTERCLQSCFRFLSLSHTHRRTCSLALFFLFYSRQTGAQQDHSRTTWWCCTSSQPPEEAVLLILCWKTG